MHPASLRLSPPPLCPFSPSCHHRSGGVLGTRGMAILNTVSGGPFKNMYQISCHTTTQTLPWLPISVRERGKILTWACKNDSHPAPSDLLPCHPPPCQAGLSTVSLTHQVQPFLAPDAHWTLPIRLPRPHPHLEPRGSLPHLLMFRGLRKAHPDHLIQSANRPHPATPSWLCSQLYHPWQLHLWLTC